MLAPSSGSFQILTLDVRTLGAASAPMVNTFEVSAAALSVHHLLIKFKYNDKIEDFWPHTVLIT